MLKIHQRIPLFINKSKTNLQNLLRFIFPIFDYLFVINLSLRSYHPVRKYIVNFHYTIHRIHTQVKARKRDQDLGKLCCPRRRIN